MLFSRTIFSLHDLTSGQCGTLNRIHDPKLREELDRAILTSNQIRHTVLIGAGKFELITDLTTIIPEGTACFYVGAGAPLGARRVAAGTILYEAIAAYWLATAPEVYRFLFARYLSEVARSVPPLPEWNAPAFLPPGVPWICGFSTGAAVWLEPEEKKLLWRLVLLIGLNLLERCERSAADAERDGNVPVLDHERYPELKYL